MKNKILYAVTDQHVILRLKIVSESALGDTLIVINTELADEETSSHADAHHDEYFKRMYLHSDGAPHSSSVFIYPSDAIGYAEKNIEEEIDLSKRNLKRLLDRQLAIKGYQPEKSVSTECC